MDIIFVFSKSNYTLCNKKKHLKSIGTQTEKMPLMEHCKFLYVYLYFYDSLIFCSSGQYVLYIIEIN